MKIDLNKLSIYRYKNFKDTNRYIDKMWTKKYSVPYALGTLSICQYLHYRDIISFKEWELNGHMLIFSYITKEDLKESGYSIEKFMEKVTGEKVSSFSYKNIIGGDEIKVSNTIAYLEGNRVNWGDETKTHYTLVGIEDNDFI